MRNTLRTTDVVRALDGLLMEYNSLAAEACSVENRASYERYTLRADAAGSALRVIYHLAGMNEYEIASLVDNDRHVVASSVAK